MKLADIMTTRVVTVELDDTLDTIRGIFTQARFRHLLVLDDDDRPVGVISDRDLFKAISPFLDTLAEKKRDTKTLERRAHQIMTRKLITARPETQVCEAADKLVRFGISCLPILDKSGAVAGIVTWKDILRRIVCQEPK